MISRVRNQIVMTLASFHRDSYLKNLTSRVTHTDDDWVELEDTIFYPEGGGQPGDTGVFVLPGGGSIRVVDTRKGERPGTIRHQLESGNHGLSRGDEIKTSIDWNRRYKLMRMHTCMHLLGSIIPVPVTGGKVGLEKSRLDFDLGDYQIDKEDLTVRMNQLVKAAHPISFESISEAQLDENPSLVRTMSVQPPRGLGEIRMVRVQEVDFQPCGGTHVNNSNEVGRVLISKIENKGKRNRRVHILLEN
jgi:misacylated tRNA(Ala) deacylase